MASDIIIQGISLTLSIIAIAVSAFTFYISYQRSRKTEQLKLCMDISSRLDDAKNKIHEIDEKLNGNTTDQQMIQGWEINLRDAFLVYLNHWEFFSFLVNTEEIHDEKILDYYKDRFRTDVEISFAKYPDVKDSKDRYLEIKKLLKKWDNNYYSSHFQSK